MLGQAILFEMSRYEDIFCIGNDVSHMAYSQSIE